MSQLLILIPTRLRPHTLKPMAQAFADTCTAATEILWCLDGCPDHYTYLRRLDEAVAIYPRSGLIDGPRRRLAGTLNHHAAEVARRPAHNRPMAIGYFGDDHRPRTPGWDTRYLEELHRLGTGMVYGDDQIQGAGLPTQIAMTVDVVTALGYMVAPPLKHLYIDNFWLDLGTGANCLTYLPDVTVEHCHPNAGKNAWDDSYAETNSPDSYAQDKAAYTHYRGTRLAADIAIVRALRGEP